MAVRRWDWDRLLAILCVLPSIIAIGIFVYAFIAWTGWASLLKWNDLLPLQGLPGLPDVKILPPAAAWPQSLVLVTDLNILAHSDGAHWIRQDTGAGFLAKAGVVELG